jgi:hypothetical protein
LKLAATLSQKIKHTTGELNPTLILIAGIVLLDK